MTRPDMKWDAWGDPNAAKPLSDGIRGLLEQALGIGDATLAELAPDQVKLRPSALSSADREGLAAIVGTENCGVDDHARLLRAGGKSTLDLLRRRDPGVQDAPDAVLLPGSEDEIAEILRLCAQRSIAVVPFGGGTSVVGGLDPVRGQFKAVISLDLRRLNELHSLDEISGEAELGAGVTGPEAEQLLGDRGFSLGHFPQSFQFATIGGFAATRSSGQDSAGYGRFNDMVRGLRAVTPAGVLDLGRAPESAAGPGPAAAADRLGGRLRRHHPRPRRGSPHDRRHPLRGVVVPRLRHRRRCAARRHPDRHRADRSSGCPTRPRPASTSPPPKASARAAITGGCLAITVFEGTEAHVESRHAETRAVLEAQRRHVARRGAGARMGTRPLQRAVPSRLTAVGGCAVRDARDRHQLVQHSAR